MGIRSSAKITAWLALAAACSAQTVFNPTTDFSITNGNPNGTWTYGWMDTGFTTFSAFGFPAEGLDGPWWRKSEGETNPNIWKNTTSSWPYNNPPGYLALHPGPSTEPCVLRWTAPAGYSSAQVTGQFLDGNTGTPNVAVRHNGTQIWTANNAGSFDLGVSLTAGDYLDFAVYGAYGAGTTPIELTITAVPEPSTFAACAGLAAWGAAVLCRKRRFGPPAESWA